MNDREVEVPRTWPGPILPFDLVTYAYLAVLFLLVVLAAPELAWPHLAIIVGWGALLGAIQAATRRSTPMTRGVTRLLYFSAALPLFYLQLKPLIPEIQPTPADARLRAIDRFIFGVDPTRALEGFDHPVVTELLNWAYISYYILPLVLPLILLLRRRAAETEKFALALLITYTVTYLGYISVPANGPVATLHHETEIEALFLGDRIYAWILEVDANRFDCFPSGHTAISILVPFYAWRFRLRTAATILTIDGALIITATVYLRYHYVIDLPAGALVAALAILVTERVYKSHLGKSHLGTGTK